MIELVQRYYAHLDAGRFDEALELFDPDAEIRIAHHPPMRGRDQIDRGMRAGLSAVASIRHEVVRSWEPDEHTVIVEVDAHYVFPGGRRLTVPGAVIAEVRDGAFVRQRVHADLTPVFAERS